MSSPQRPSSPAPNRRGRDYTVYDAVGGTQPPLYSVLLRLTLQQAESSQTPLPASENPNPPPSLRPQPTTPPPAASHPKMSCFAVKMPQPATKNMTSTGLTSGIFPSYPTATYSSPYIPTRVYSTREWIIG